MNLLNIFNISLKGLRTNKIRSFLTMLGIIIGIASVIIIMSVGAGAQGLILSQVEKVGSNLIGIMPGAADAKGPPAAAYGITVTTLKDEDGAAIAKQIPEVMDYSSYSQGIDTISWQNQKEDATFMGVSSSYINVENTEVIQGRFFSKEEQSAVGRVAVLGPKLADNLFSGEGPIGQRIKIRREIFEVIGILKERGSVAFSNPDNMAYIPISSAQKLLLGVHHVNLIRVKISPQADPVQVIEQMKEILRSRHDIKNVNEDDFDIRNQADAIELLTTLTNALKFFLAAIAAISLIVGGIGIMNIMYVVVTERTNEIGLRKAIGAKESNLLTQFLIEAMVITGLGGIIGIMFGVAFSALVAAIANYLGYSWKLVVTPFSILLGTSVSVIIGLFFGLFPARKAAKLDPIEALRYE